MILGRTGFARKGEWTAAVTYDALDIVTYEGKVYIGRRESVGSEPSSESNDWTILPGAPSFEIEETASGYDLTITGSDGTSETISILNGEVDREELEDALEAFRSSTDAYLAPDHDDTATYSAGDSCIYEGRLYRCIEDIPTAEPWTAEHWEPVVLSNKVAQLRKDAVVKADVVVSSAEPGDVVIIADGADNVPVKELVVGVEPIQDLHGQSAPYPAGGGKNKIGIADGVDFTLKGIRYRVEGGSLYLDGTATGETSSNDSAFKNAFSFVLGAGTYYFSRGSYGSAVYLKSESGNLVTNNGSFTITEQTTVWFGFYMYNVTFSNVQVPLSIVLGSNPPSSYSPFSNFCPISGWTGVEVYQSKGNIWNEQWELGTIDNSGQKQPSNNAFRSKNYMDVYPKQKLYVYVGANKFIYMKLYTADETFVSGVNARNQEITIPNNASIAKMLFSVGSEYGATYLNDISINYPSTITTYNAVTTIPISWQSEAGTVYGGSLDLTTGVLTVDYKINTLTSFDGAWGSYSNGYAVYVSVSGSTHSNVNTQLMKCNYFAYSGLGYNSMPVYSYGGTSGSAATHTFVLPTTITSLAEANAWLASLDTFVQFMTKLSTPLVFQLSPVQIRSLFGVNTFWSNSNGGIQSLRYVSDLKLYLEQLTKPTEDDMTANSNIPANTYFNVGNVLYLSTAAIAAGEKIEPDTNCTRKSLADALNDLHD